MRTLQCIVYWQRCSFEVCCSFYAPGEIWVWFFVCPLLYLLLGHFLEPTSFQRVLLLPMVMLFFSNTTSSSRIQTIGVSTSGNFFLASVFRQVISTWYSNTSSFYSPSIHLWLNNLLDFYFCTKTLLLILQNARDSEIKVIINCPTGGSSHSFLRGLFGCSTIAGWAVPCCFLRRASLWSRGSSALCEPNLAALFRPFLNSRWLPFPAIQVTQEDSWRWIQGISAPIRTSIVLSSWGRSLWVSRSRHVSALVLLAWGMPRAIWLSRSGWFWASATLWPSLQGQTSRSR